MTITIDVPDDLQQRLTDAAARQGVSAESFALELLRRELPRSDRAAAVADLLRSWIEEGDEAEQRDTFDYLAQVLDEDRPSYRKLFPPELKGISW